MQGKKVGTFGRMGIYSFQAPSRCPASKAGMGVYQKPGRFRAGDHPSATTRLRPLAAPPALRPATALAQNSPYQQYEGTGLGMKLRMHPLAAVLMLKQMETLDARNAMINRPRCGRSTIGSASCRGCPSRSAGPTSSGSTIRPTCCSWTRPRRACRGRRSSRPCRPKASRSAPAITRRTTSAPSIASRNGGTTRSTCPRSCTAARRSTPGRSTWRCSARNAPELVEQYIKAFEKVWAHRDAVAKLA